MRIEKNFYDEEKRQYEEIWNALSLERETLSKEELEKEVHTSELDAERIKRACEEENRRIRRVKDIDKFQHFQILSGQALWMAEALALNIMIEEFGKYYGRIVLEAGEILLVYNLMAREILCDLLLEACEVYTSAPSGMCRMEFVFSLYREAL